MNRLSKGFTLIEILVAVAIFGLLSVGAYTVLDAALKSRQQTESRLSKLEELQRAVQIIEKDLRMLSQRQVRDELGDKVPVFRGQSEESGQSSSLELTRSNWRNPAGLPRSNLQHVIYNFDQGKLKRLQTIFLDQASNSPNIVQTLLEDVKAFKIAFLDNNDQWQDSWSMFSPLAGQKLLPKAIKLQIEFEPFGTIDRLILMTTVAESTAEVNNSPDLSEE